MNYDDFLASEQERHYKDNPDYCSHFNLNITGAKCLDCGTEIEYED